MSRYCASCGALLGGDGASTRERRAWVAAAAFAILVVGMLVVLVLREKSSAMAVTEQAAAAVGSAAPPDLSTMSPRERFDRLYKRVMGAAETGDSATVARFAPMVFAAYDQLDTVDADARYHAAVLQLHVLGDKAAALRLADSILAVTPRHLFGFLIRGMAARLAGDTRLLDRAHGDLLAAWDREMAAGRAEYRDHQAMLEQFRAAAPAAKTPDPGPRTPDP